MSRPNLLMYLLATGLVALELSGCALKTTNPTIISPSARMSGRVHGGQQPVSHATIQLYAVGTTGDGSNATPLLTQQVLTDASGNFTITGLYPCSGSTLVYITATAGNPGLTTENPNLALMTALGPCTSLTSSTFISINEATSVAAVAALAPFMTSVTAVGSASSDAALLSSAFTLSSELVNNGTGLAPGVVPNGASVPVSLINTLADIIAGCVNSTGGVAGDTTVCGSLFTLTTPPNGTFPTDTIAALLNVANNPTNNTVALFNLSAAVAPFQPQLGVAPSNFQVRLAQSTSLLITPGTGLSFTSAQIGATTSAQAITLTNAGSTPIHIASANITGINAADFAASSTCPATLAASASCSMSVSFSPLLSASRNAYLTIVSDAGDSPQAIPLSGGSPAAAQLTFTPGNTLSFLPAAIGTSASMLITVTNSGPGDITVNSIGISGTNASDFSQSNNCGSSMAAEATCSITASFTPASAGNRLSNITIASNATNPSAVFALSGTGITSGLISNGLIASYPLNDGSGTSPADESGNGYTASFCPSPATPIWTQQGLLLNASASACIALPTSLPMTTVRTIEMAYTTVAPYEGNPFSGPYPCWICSTSGNGLGLLSFDPNGTQPVFYQGYSAPSKTGTGSHILTFTNDDTQDHWYFDGVEAPYAQAGNSLSLITNAALNPQWLIGASPGLPAAFQGTFHYVRFLNRALSSSEVAQDAATMESIAAQRGVVFRGHTTPISGNRWLAHGDSRTVGFGTGVPYAAYLNNYSSATYQTKVLGLSGYGIDTLSRTSPNYDCYFYSPTSSQNIASIWEGTNNLAGGDGSNSPGAFGYLVDDLKTFRSCGFTTIVANDPSRINADAAEQVWDAYWRDRWQPYADGFVDLGADPQIGGTNAYQNTTYYDPDGIHMRVAGYDLVAQKFAREANFLKGSNPNNCAKVVATTYTLLDADGCTKFDPSAAAFIVTLYDANDFTGRKVYLQNTATSGSSTLTISAATGQTIDGANSIAIPNGTIRILEIVNANSSAPAGAGNNWHVLQ